MLPGGDAELDGVGAGGMLKEEGRVRARAASGTRMLAESLFQQIADAQDRDREGEKEQYQPKSETESMPITFAKPAATMDTARFSVPSITEPNSPACAHVGRHTAGPLFMD